MAAICRALALALLLSACGGTVDTTSTTTMLSSTTTTVSTTTTTVSTTTTLSEEVECLAFTVLMGFYLTSTVEALAQGTEAAIAVADNQMTLSEGADQLLLAAEDLRVANDGLADLGEPPAALEESVRLMRRALERLIEGYELGSRGMRNEDLSMIEAGSTLIQEGTAFINGAAEALGDC